MYYGYGGCVRTRLLLKKCALKAFGVYLHGKLILGAPQKCVLHNMCVCVCVHNKVSCFFTYVANKVSIQQKRRNVCIHMRHCIVVMAVVAVAVAVVVVVVINQKKNQQRTNKIECKMCCVRWYVALNLRREKKTWNVKRNRQKFTICCSPIQFAHVHLHCRQLLI